MHRRLGTCVRRIWLLAIVAMLVIGCGGAEELRSGAQTEKFIDDIAHGGKADDWELADGATAAATAAWSHQGTIQQLGAKLREEGPEWACEAAESVENAHKVIVGLKLELLPQERNSIVSSAGLQGADSSEANSVIDDSLDLSPLELAETVSSLCRVAKQF